MRSKLVLGSMMLSAALAACQNPYCPDSLAEDRCNLSFVANPTTYVRGKDKFITVSVQGRSGDEPIKANLIHAGISHELTPSAAIGHEYQLNLPSDILLFKTLRLGDLSVSLSQGTRTATPQTIHLTQPLTYQTPTIFMSMKVEKTELSLVDYIGIANHTIYGLSSGLFVGVTVRQTRRYTYTAGNFQEPTNGDYLDGLLAPNALLAAGSSNVYLSQSPNMPAQKVISCPARPTDVKAKDCPPLMFGLPAGTQSMVVTPDEKRIILADSTGALHWGTLPAAPADTPFTSMPPGTTVRLATTDLDGDMQPDLIAVWQSVGNPPTVTVKVFLWKTLPDGFVEDTSLSSRLSTAVGTTPITALAAGDVDNDGFGNVVFARGGHVFVLHGHRDDFAPAWSAPVEPAPAGSITINAIAVGRIDSSSPSGKLLDIVTASNSGYNNDNKNTLYLHAFRPQ